MDFFSWFEPVDNSSTSRAMNLSSHAGVYRRASTNQVVRGKATNPGIYAGGSGRSRGGCLAGMRGFDPIDPVESVSTSCPSPAVAPARQRGHLFRAARSLSPQKGMSLASTSNYSDNKDFEFQGTSFHAGGYAPPLHQAGGYAPPLHQASAISAESPKGFHKFRAAPAYQESPTNVLAYTPNTFDAEAQHVYVMEAQAQPTVSNAATSPPKNDTTPSTSDQSDVDDLVPRSIHSPSMSESQTPPSSSPGTPTIPSPTASNARPRPGPDSSDSSDAAETPLAPRKLPPKEAPKKSPFASLDLQDQGVVKARMYSCNAQMLNKNFTGQCRSLEDEMSELTKDLEALRAQLKSRN